MRIEDAKILTALPNIGVDRLEGAALTEYTSLGIGGTTDILLIKRRASIPELVRMLDDAGYAHKFLGGGSNLLIRDGELPWVMLHLVKPEPEVRLEGNFAFVDAAADLGRTVTF